MAILKTTLLNDQFSYQKNDVFEDENFHKEAIYNLEKTLSNNPKSVGPLCDWIASHHELALIYQNKGCVESAQKCLLIPHQAMLYMAQNDHGDAEQKLVALKAISLTLPPLIEFAKKHPPCQTCINTLNSQLSLIENNHKNYH